LYIIFYFLKKLNLRTSSPCWEKNEKKIVKKI
jgi:hypothetical protein